MPVNYVLTFPQMVELVAMENSRQSVIAGTNSQLVFKNVITIFIHERSVTQFEIRCYVSH